VLLARARDRVSTLRSLYGAGPLEIDFRELAERARLVKTVRCELRRVAVERRSSRTGQRHGIGGFIGSAEYEGDLAEFLPFLEAAHWTGVGRHCTWGNGEIHTAILNSEF
jgi:CRISPR-associated endoribonuclease Cas6